MYFFPWKNTIFHWRKIRSILFEKETYLNKDGLYFRRNSQIGLPPNDGILYVGNVWLVFLVFFPEDKSTQRKGIVIGSLLSFWSSFFVYGSSQSLSTVHISTVHWLSDWVTGSVPSHGHSLLGNFRVPSVYKPIKLSMLWCCSTHTTENY